jgi:hypothetical protein
LSVGDKTFQHACMKFWESVCVIVCVRTHARVLSRARTHTHTHTQTQTQTHHIHTHLSGRTNYSCFKIWWVSKSYSSVTGTYRHKVMCVAYFQTYHIHLCYIHQAVKMQAWLSCLSHGMTVQVGQHCTPSISVFMPLLCLVTFWCHSACKDSLFALIVVIWLRFTRFEDSRTWVLHFPFLPSLCLCVHVRSIWFVLRSKVRSGKESTHSPPPLWIATTYRLGAFPQ